MRTILIAMLAAAGIGLLGTSGASAVPANGWAVHDAAVVSDQVTKAGWGHGRYRSHWRWGSRGGGHGRWGSRGRWWR